MGNYVDDLIESLCEETDQILEREKTMEEKNYFGLEVE